MYSFKTNGLDFDHHYRKAWSYAAAVDMRGATVVFSPSSRIARPLPQHVWEWHGDVLRDRGGASVLAATDYGPMSACPTTNNAVTTVVPIDRT